MAVITSEVVEDHRNKLGWFIVKIAGIVSCTMVVMTLLKMVMVSDLVIAQRLVTNVTQGGSLKACSSSGVKLMGSTFLGCSRCNAPPSAWHAGSV